MNGLPSVRVILPTRNRPDLLSVCLASLALQDYPPARWHAVVVNDGGSEPSGALSEATAKSFTCAFISIPPSGPAAARNRGARGAAADLLVFLDDDCRADSSWLRELVCGMAASPYQAGMGRTLNGLPGRPSARAYQYYMDFYRDYERMANGDLYLLMSNNAVYRREAFEALGGFNENFPRPGAEDLELSHRMVAQGFRQGFFPQAVLHHANPSSASAYLHQQYQYGRGYRRAMDRLRRSGIPSQVGQRRRPQFHLALLQAMLRTSPGAREAALIWCGILAHTIGAHHPEGAPSRSGAFGSRGADA